MGNGWLNDPWEKAKQIGTAALGSVAPLSLITSEPFQQATGLGQTPVSPMPTVDPRGYTPGLQAGYTEEQRKKYESGQATQAMRASMDYARQQQLANEYQRVLEGKTPSLAEQQMQAGQAQAMQQAAQMAASARGGTAGLLMAQRSAQQQAALGTAGVARDTAMLRAKEIAEARGQLGQLSTAMRGMSQEQLRAYMQAQENIDKMQLEGSMAYQRDTSGLAKAQAEQETKAAQETAKRRSDLLGKGAEVAAKALAGLPCHSTTTRSTRTAVASRFVTAAPARNCSRRPRLAWRACRRLTRSARRSCQATCPRPRAWPTRRSYSPWCLRGSHCSARAAWRWQRRPTSLVAAQINPYLAQTWP